MFLKCITVLYFSFTLLIYIRIESKRTDLEEVVGKGKGAWLVFESIVSTYALVGTI